MPRAGRTFEEGRTYHVYNRVGGGFLPFTDDELAKTFVGLLRKVVDRDGAVVLGWCLLGNHYHLVARQGAVPLSRSMKTLQQGVTRARNVRDRVYGPLWQGRFKAKQVNEYVIPLVLSEKGRKDVYTRDIIGAIRKESGIADFVLRGSVRINVDGRKISSGSSRHNRCNGASSSGLLSCSRREKTKSSLLSGLLTSTC